MRTAIGLWAGDSTVELQIAIGNAQSECDLGTATYDGEEVMSDPQKDRANIMMVSVVGTIQPLLSKKFLNNHDKMVISKAVETYNGLAEALLAEVAGP
jgi:hypothetical protein